MTKHVFDIEETMRFIRKQSKETSVLIGSDSERFKKNGLWYASYSVAIVVHIDSCHGCKVFGEMTVERDYDQVKNRPSMRLLHETQLVADMFTRLKDCLEDKRVEVHIDINADPKHGSSCVVSEAMGYLKGVVGDSAMVFCKPFAPAASFASDSLSKILSNENVYAVA
jgi:predicted RNase H-related nuclease YkuK (DUF458 family)